ncbi:MAG TPA: NADH:ubiquinone oxidoreductase [Polyangia bacterium]|jgi:coenzyme F420-reducing hydrogenase gamma subunit
MRYLGIEPQRPKVAVFDFTSCEGCELQLVNKEDTLVPFLKAVEVVNFREATTARSDVYDVALVEGCISRADEIDRLREIRERAKVLVALGSCACYGGVARLKNAFDLAAANREVYGDKPKDTLAVRPLKDIVKVDLELPGCPVSKAEVEHIVKHLIMEVPYQFPVYPVCVDCKQRFTSCMFERGQLCLGSITRAGCDAPCPAGGLGCWGCRGPAADPNYPEFFRLAKERGHSDREIAERMGFFGGFEGAK